MSYMLLKKNHIWLRKRSYYSNIVKLYTNVVGRTSFRAGASNLKQRDKYSEPEARYVYFNVETINFELANFVLLLPNRFFSFAKHYKLCFTRACDIIFPDFYFKSRFDHVQIMSNLDDFALSPNCLESLGPLLAPKNLDCF